MKSYLKVKLQEIRKYYPDWEYSEIGIGTDHVHLHMIIPPKYSVSKVVETIKTNTSRAIRSRFGFLDKVYWDDRGVGGKGYTCRDQDECEAYKAAMTNKLNTGEGRYRTSGA